MMGQESVKLLLLVLSSNLLHVFVTMKCGKLIYCWGAKELCALWNITQAAKDNKAKAFKVMDNITKQEWQHVPFFIHVGETEARQLTYQKDVVPVREAKNLSSALKPSASLWTKLSNRWEGMLLTFTSNFTIGTAPGKIWAKEKMFPTSAFTRQ